MTGRSHLPSPVATLGAVMYLLRGLAVWLLNIAVETVHGVLRTALLAPVVGDFRARQYGVVTGSLLIFAVTYFCIRGCVRPRPSAC